jgi:hypothetical protein
MAKIDSKTITPDPKDIKMDQIKKDGPKVKKPKDPTKTFSYRTKR